MYYYLKTLALIGIATVVAAQAMVLQPADGHFPITPSTSTTIESSVVPYSADSFVDSLFT